MTTGYIDLPVEGGSGSGVSSLNTLTGAIVLVAGTGITITPSGNNLTIAASGSGGVTTVGTYDSQSASANGLVISGTSIYAQSADATHPGMVNTGTQTFAGAKTFSSAIVASLTGHASLDLALTGGTMSGALNMGSNLINAVADPVSAQDAATKNYVDTAISGLNWKAAVRLASAAALPTNVYNNGASGVGATLTGVALAALSIDGSAVVAGNRVLIKNEATQANNGIYTVTVVGSAGLAYVLTRATDFDQAADVAEGDTVFVSEGTVNSNTSWAESTAGPFTIGTTAITFVQVAGPGTVTAGTGISVAGNTVSLATPVSVANGGTGTTTGNFLIAAIVFNIDGGGSAITTGVKGYVSIPFACTINSWDIFADQSGSIVIDVWKDTYANFPPDVADTIAGSEKPTLSSAQKNQDLTLSTWTTAITAGDVLAFNVDSASTVTRVNLIIKVTKT